MSAEQVATFGFHYRNGFHFKRLDDGSVLLTKTAPFGVLHPDFSGEVPGGDPLKYLVADWTLTIDPTGWASIVAAVSARGETADTFHEAEAFHALTHPADDGRRSAPWLWPS